MTLFTIRWKTNHSSLLLSTLVQSNLCREKLNISLLPNIGTAYVLNHRAIYYVIPSSTSKSMHEYVYHWEWCFQLGGIAGGKGKSAFPLPESILRWTELLNIFASARRLKLLEIFQKHLIVTFLNRSLRE